MVISPITGPGRLQRPSGAFRVSLPVDVAQWIEPLITDQVVGSSNLSVDANLS